MSEPHVQHLDVLPLWPEGVPAALGDGIEDNPSIVPYLLPGQLARAAIVVCPGGGYARRAPHEGEPVARWLNSLGIAAVVLNYRVAPYKHPHPLSDAQRAIRLVRFHAKEWQIDPDRIGILGFSAGGHLTASAGTHYDYGSAEAPDTVERESCRPNLLILCYPVITFCEYRHHGSMVNLLGNNPLDALREELSAERQVTPDTPPAFLWHTADDQGVPVENSLLFAQALSTHKVPFELHVYPSGRHGLGLAENEPQVSTWTQLCASWLAARGFTGVPND